jgi:hypothetical protein
MDSAFLKLGGGDPIRADELRAKTTGSLLTFIMTTYIPLWVVVGLLVVHRPQGVDQVGLAEQRDAVKAYAFRYVDAYLKDPSNSALIRQFYDGDVPASVLPPGGRALIPASALPGAIDDGFRTYSVVIDSEIPKAANSKSMVSVPLEVDISIDPHNNLFRAFTLPHANTDRPAGRPVELATQTLISDDRPVYKTVSGFLDAMLLGRGELSPFVAAGTSLRAADPPRFTTLAIERVQADTEDANAQDVPPKADGVEVTVRAVVQTASGVAMPMDFPLVLSVAAGHWQVERINAAPTITAPPDSGSSNSSTTTPTTPTTTSRKPGPATPEGS